MNIDEMSAQEKSVMLAKAMGWSIEHHDSEDSQTGKIYYISWISDSNGTPIKWSYDDGTIEWSIPAFKPFWKEFRFNFYNPADMALAWRVLNWAWNQDHKANNTVFENEVHHGCVVWSWVLDLILDGDLPPVDAQRTWLDKILSLAIEAGIVELPESS